MKIPSYIWIAGVFLLGGGFLLFLTNSKNASINEDATLPVTVEVFSDYNCPHCASFLPVAQDVENTFGDKVVIEKKQSPFLSETSSTYAYAAEAAKLQGQLDLYNTELFKWITYQRDPNNIVFTYTDDEKEFYSPPVDVTLLADRLGLDVDKFEADRVSQEVARSVQEQKSDLIKRRGAVSTPSIFIYGKYFDMSGLTLDAFKNKVQELITLAESKQNEAQ